MAGMRWNLVFLCPIIFTGFTADGLCPSDITPVIDLCEDKSFSGLGLYLDAAGMAASGRSSCSCSVTSTASLDVQYTSMLTNQSRNCEYYNYNVQLTLDNVQTWTCANPNGFGFTYQRLDTENPWYIYINKTESGVIAAPDADPGYCLILVAGALQPLNVICGNGSTTTTEATTTEATTTEATTTEATTTEATTTATTPMTSSSAMTSTSQTSVPTMTVETTLETTTQSETTSSVSATTGLGGTSDTTSGGTTTVSEDTTSTPAGTTATSMTSSTQITPGSFGDYGDTDTGVGVIAGGIVAGLTLFFLIALGCYFCNRYDKRKERKEEEEHDRHSIVTSTTNVAGYPYRQTGDRYVYYMDTSTHSNKDYLYLWSQ